MPALVVAVDIGLTLGRIVPPIGHIAAVPIDGLVQRRGPQRIHEGVLLGHWRWAILVRHGVVPTGSGSGSAAGLGYSHCACERASRVLLGRLLRLEQPLVAHKPARSRGTVCRARGPGTGRCPCTLATERSCCRSLVMTFAHEPRPAEGSHEHISFKRCLRRGRSGSMVRPTRSRCSWLGWELPSRLPSSQAEPSSLHFVLVEGGRLAARTTVVQLGFCCGR
jgi:hypothetical protein